MWQAVANTRHVTMFPHIPCFQVSFTTLNIRLSYNDLKLFMAILNSMPKQLLEATQQMSAAAPPRNARECNYPGWSQWSALIYSSLRLIRMPLLPRNSVLIGEVSFGDREHHMHSQYLLPRIWQCVLSRGVSCLEGCPLKWFVLNRICPDRSYNYIFWRLRVHVGSVTWSKRIFINLIIQWTL